MPLNVNFTATQISGAPGDIVFTDTSTGTDVAVTQRRIYVQTPDGEYLVEDGVSTEYSAWADYPSTSTITLDLLPKDYACTITVQWLNVSNVVLYDKVLITSFTLYNETFDYSLSQRASGNPMLMNDNNFFTNKSLLRLYIDSGNQAIEQASDTFTAQQLYDAATTMRTNKQYLFNGNS